MKTFTKFHKQLVEKYIGNSKDTQETLPGTPLHSVDKSNISDQEHNALKDYIECCNINYHHRGILPPNMDSKAISEYKDRAKQHSDRNTPHLDSIIGKHKLDNDTHFWRGIDYNPRLKKGDILHDKGYVSTSLNPRISRVFGTDHIMHIKAPKGSSAIQVNTVLGEHSRNYEHEVILPRNSKFRYEGSKEGKYGTTVHTLTHIPEGE